MTMRAYNLYIMLTRVIAKIYLNAKVFATLIKCKFFLPTQKFLLVIIQLTSPVLCLAYNIKIRPRRLMVAEKTSKLKVTHFSLHAKMKFQTNVCLQKQKGQHMQLWSFYALVDVYFVCVACLSLNVIGC